MLRKSIIEWDKIPAERIESRYRTSEPAMPGLFAELHSQDGELQWRKAPDAESMRTLAVYVERAWAGRDASGRYPIDQEYPAGDTVTVAYLQTGDIADCLVPSGVDLASHMRMEIGAGGYAYPTSDLSASAGRARLQLMAGAPGKVNATRRVVLRVVG